MPTSETVAVGGWRRMMFLEMNYFVERTRGLSLYNFFIID